MSEKICPIISWVSGREITAKLCDNHKGSFGYKISIDHSLMLWTMKLGLTQYCKRRLLLMESREKSSHLFLELNTLICGDLFESEKLGVNPFYLVRSLLYMLLATGEHNLHYI